MEELNHIQRALQMGYHLNIGAYFSRGWNIFSKYLGGFIGFALILSLATIIIGLIPCVSTLFLLAVLPMLQIGYAIVADLIHRERNYSFNDFFGGFNRYGDLFVVNLLTLIFIVLAAIPGIILMIIAVVGMSSELNEVSGPEELLPILVGNALFVISILVTLVGVIAMVIWFILAPQLVYFNRMDSWPAMMTSMKLINKRWINWFLFLVLMGIILMAPQVLSINNSIDMFREIMGRASRGEGSDSSMVLESLFSVGQIISVVLGAFIQPFIQCTTYAAFADITGLDKQDNGTGFIEDHFAVNE